jgi:hypothetical protein
VIADAVLEFAAEAIALSIVFGAIGAAFAAAGSLGSPARTSLIGAVAGAMIVAALADRLGAPTAWVLEFGRRSVPMAWSAAGAAIGTAAALAVGLRRRARPTAAEG